MEMSKLSTKYFQPSLPRLPIPSLQQTMSRYLAAQKPLLRTEDYQWTEKLAAEFATKGSVGWKVHQQLVERDKKNPHTSYIARFWHDRYMKDRRPSLNLRNPCLVVKQDPRSPNQVDRAVNFIHSAVRFRNSLTDNKLEPDLVYNSPVINPQSLKSLIKFVPQRFASQVALLSGAIPLDMSQYDQLFGTTRIPKRGKDELVHSLSSQHVVVMRNGHLYCVEAQQANGLPTDPDQLYSTLSAIVNDPSPPPPYPVSYLTATDRDIWADVQRQLIADPQNAYALKRVESALFIVCLDHREPETPLDALHTFLHNQGFNRWFDKSLQLMVSPSADVGASFEHSWGDAYPFLSFMNRVFLDTVHHPYIPPTTVTGTPTFERLQFHLTGSLKHAVERTRAEVEERCRLFTIHRMEYPHYGKLLLKSKGLSPNGTLQLAFQMTYYRQFGCFDSTVQSCSTAAFLHGRTEWIHPGTMAAKACTEAFQPSSGASTTEKWRLLKKAVAQYSRLCREAAAGQGFDRHLFALKCVAEEEGLSLALFEDPAYARLNRHLLFTSTIKVEALKDGGFGPLSQDGIAVGYIVREGSMYFCISAHSVEKVNAFVSNLRIVLDSIQNVVTSL